MNNPLAHPSSVRSPEVLRRQLAAGVPPTAVTNYALLWQLETWLRTVVYVELRSKHGAAWLSALDSRALARAKKDIDHEYLRSPDSSNPLAYLDFDALLTAIQDDWDLFRADLLPDLDVWIGRMREVIAIRHRIGHCRVPNSADTDRLVSMLRDLLPGARGFNVSYHEALSVSDVSGKDSVVGAWRDGLGIGDLVDHARASYSTTFTLGVTARPWCGAVVDPLTSVSGMPGLLWRARWTVRDGWVEPTQLWERLVGYPVPDVLLHLMMPTPHEVIATFPAMDDSGEVTGAIDAIFDATLGAIERYSASTDDPFARWPISHPHDHRLQLGTFLSDWWPDPATALIFNVTR